MKSKLRFHLCFICMLALAVAGCKVKRPNDVIPESKMESLLYDYHLAKSMGDNLPYSENYKKALYIDAVFKKYGTTQAVFDSSMVWYTRNTEVLSKIYEKVKKRLKDQQDEVNHLIALRDKKPKMTEPGDSLDVWPWLRMIRLTGEMMNNRYSFVLPTDTNYKDRDTLVWEVNYRFLEPMLADSLRAVAMGMQVIYEKDTINHLKTITRPGVQQIRLYADTLGAMKEIRGFIYYPMLGEQKGGTLLADHFTMTRYHCKDTLAFAVRDSLNKIEALKADSLKKISEEEVVDSLHKVAEEHKEDVQRLTPEEMNRRRTGTQREKKPEQIEVEQHIQQERIEQRKERQMNQRRQQQQRRQTRYLFMPDVGFIKQQVVEITDEGVVRDTFPLTEEIESVEWMPGVIVLLPADQLEEIKNTGMILKNIPVFQINPSNILNQSSRCFEESLKELKEKGEVLFPVLFYPFDFISMQPVDGTRHRLLR